MHMCNDRKQIMVLWNGDRIRENSNLSVNIDIHILAI